MLIWVMIVFVSSVYSQEKTEFIFADNQSALDVSSVNKDIRDPLMGMEVAKKMVLFKDRYTYVEAGTPASPSNRTIVLKPVIFNSIQKLNRHFKKQIKKGDMDPESARDFFLPCLDTALILYAEETEEFEDYLRKQKKPEEILDAYQRVVLK
ncbi:MAG: hypothetical protein PVF73_06665 [Bacteroidales bacterium]|jgi:hypothetical protein